MKIVNVNASRNYNILIENGLIDRSGELIRKITKAKNAVIITDDTVHALYSARVEKSLQGNGFDIFKYIIPHGEDSKSAKSFISILNYLADNKISRSDIIVALGGGVVGDLAGFCASSYLRGIEFVQIPTTLLSMVDSSVGGKTAINLDAGKNLAGAFYQPSLVICDPVALETLPDDIFADGCAEVIKYGIIGDRPLFDKLERGIDENTDEIIENCVKNKRDIVNIDERDTGVRQLLNLGHTIGHAIEQNSGFSVSHGSAVAIGTYYVSKISNKLGHLADSELARIKGILELYKLPTECPYTPDEIYKVAVSDKKIASGSINLVLPFAIGDSRLFSVEIGDLPKILKMGV